MIKFRLGIFIGLVLALLVLSLGTEQAAAQTKPPYTIGNPPGPLYVPNPPMGFNPNVNYNYPNYAYSPNLRKFVDSLPGLGLPGCTLGTGLPPSVTGGTCNQNNLGQYIPVALKNNTLYGNDDYYHLQVGEYSMRMHSDLPPTRLRGYAQVLGTNSGETNDPAIGGVYQYLGPLILAKSFDPSKPAGNSALGNIGNGAPVRLLVDNKLPIGTPGKLFIPVDPTLEGAGPGPSANQSYSDNRIVIHLHGGATPWISDGTPHQWFTPAGETFPNATNVSVYQKGFSFQNVPDMIGAGKSIAAPSAGDGKGTYYYTNEQSQRLMFYHDHAYGTTRLNVYAGMAAGYLLYDQTEDDMIDGANNSGAFTSAPLPGPVLPNLGGPYRYGIPLVIQDKTFVNDATTQATVTANGFTGVQTYQTMELDPLWNTYAKVWNTGTNAQIPAPGGSLWFPHEYMPNEDIFNPSLGGAIPWGRWDYAPWLNPPLVPVYTVLPTPSHVPESYFDTMIVNGTAYPYVSVPPQAVRFRILNAANDRVLNLQLYVAADKKSPTIAGSTGAVLCDGTTGVPAGDCTEVKMVSATRHPATPWCSTVAVPDPKTGLPTGCTPLSWPVDGREGGVPDPLTAGPKIVQIGNEGGILPQVVEIPAQPVNYEYNRRVPTLLNITDQSLLLMPAERADVILDFSQYAGQTLILYNDNAAPMSLFDDRTDLFTGQPDWTAIGGAPSISPGFGPNTRTVMQIRVGAASSCTATPCPTFSQANLTTALPKAYAATQAPPIVPQAAYNAAFGTNNVDTYVTNIDETVNLKGGLNPVTSVMVALPGSGYTTAPTVTFISKTGSAGEQPASATACLNGATAVTVTAAGTGYTSAPTVALTRDPADPGLNGVAAGTPVAATAVATVSGGGIVAITITNPGCNYTLNPIVTITGGGGTGAAATSGVTLGGVGAIRVNAGGLYTKAPMVFISGGGGLGAVADAMITGDTVIGMKNITEGFEPWYGRMNVMLGTTPVPLDPFTPAPQVPGIAQYIDPPSDFWDDGKIYVFRIAHLGVDSHIVHFHLANLQVINRVDFTNGLMPPLPNELGWKESIRTNPFTDLIVAVKPKSQYFPFKIPQSSRLMDPTTPAGSTAHYVQPAAVPGLPNPVGISNVITNYGWEYVWHCHLLGHEENDMMRPLILNVAAPPVPTGLAAALNQLQVTLTWVPAANTTATIYTLQRSNSAGAITSFTLTGLPPAATYTDTLPSLGTYYYRVRAENGAGVSAWSTVLMLSMSVPTAPSNLVAAAASTTTINLSWRDNSNNETSFTVWRSVNGAAAVQIGTVARTGTQTTGTGGTVTYSDTTVSAPNSYAYTVRAVNATGASAPSNTATVNLSSSAPTPVTSAKAAVFGTTTTSYRVGVMWVNPAGNNQTGFRIQYSTDPTFATGVTTATAAATATYYNTPYLTRGKSYYFRVQAFNTAGPPAAGPTGYVTATPAPVPSP